MLCGVAGNTDIYIYIIPATPYIEMSILYGGSKTVKPSGNDGQHQ